MDETTKPLGCLLAHSPSTTCGQACIWAVERTADVGVQFTLALIKPDAVAAGLVPEIRDAIGREFDAIASKTFRLSRDQAKALYVEHVSKPFFDELVAFMTSGPIVAMVLQGSNAIARWRAMLGATDPRNAEPWTLRGRYGDKTGIVYRNVAHGSSSVEASAREQGFIFPPTSKSIAFNVEAALARLKAEFELDGGRWDRSILERGARAMEIGIRTQHELELVLAALGFTEVSNAYGRIMGLEMSPEPEEDSAQRVPASWPPGVRYPG